MKKNKKHYDKYKKFDVVYADFGRNPHLTQVSTSTQVHGHGNQ